MAWMNLLSVIYPVGSIYWSYNATSPASIIGGTWSQFTNTFLRPSTSAGTTGGADTVTLAESQVPSLYAGFYIRQWDWGNVTTAVGQIIPIALGRMSIGTSSLSTTLDTLAHGSGAAKMQYVEFNYGGDGAHNNIPAYTTVYCWRRTA